jgi:hypothetical protein
MPPMRWAADVPALSNRISPALVQLLMVVLTAVFITEAVIPATALPSPSEVITGPWLWHPSSVIAPAASPEPSTMPAIPAT